MSNKPVILTGIRANNDLHIGNYFGALMPLIRMARAKSNTYDINLFIPDLHSFTTPIDHRLLLNQTFHNLKIFAAAGLPLDNPSIRIYRQSFVPAHSELTWILDCFTGFGEMSRMTQFKDKSVKLASEDNDGDEQRISVGLFNYPILMAADMLLYSASYIPVGEDQSQHLEFTRDIAERLNSKFIAEFPEGLFILPKSVKEQHAFFGREQGLRIRDLQNPLKKMSKSDNSGKGIIFLGDDPEVAYKKIMSAETDSIGIVSMDYENQPGISNLLNLLRLLGGNQEEFIGASQYGPLKKQVAELTKTFLLDFQKKLERVDEDIIAEKLKYDETLMREVSNYQLYRVQQAVGLRPLSA
jgi:tryptophanyl-tRNA synthetase